MKKLETQTNRSLGIMMTLLVKGKLLLRKICEVAEEAVGLRAPPESKSLAADIHPAALNEEG